MNTKKLSKAELVKASSPIPVLIKNKSDQAVLLFGKIIRAGTVTQTPFIKRPSEWEAIDFANLEAIQYIPGKLETVEVSPDSPNIPKPAFKKATEAAEPKPEAPKAKPGPISDQKLFETGQAAPVDIEKMKKDQADEIARIQADKAKRDGAPAAPTAPAAPASEPSAETEQDKGDTGESGEPAGASEQGDPGTGTPTDSGKPTGGKGTGKGRGSRKQQKGEQPSE